MKKQLFSKDWLLSAPRTNGFVKVDLPNDYSISIPRNPAAPGGPADGYFVGGRARYLKYFEKPEAAHVILDVDGSYMLSQVRFNEDHMITHPHGYTPYLVDLTCKLKTGTNKLEIDTDDMQPSTRWYSGAGIYRDVFLWTGGDVRIEPWDLYVVTLAADDEKAVLNVRCMISSDKDTDGTLLVRIPGCADHAEAFAAKAGEKIPVSFDITVENPRLWDTENPNLYRLEAEVTVDGSVTDTFEQIFGIRTISADAGNGFMLNGKPMKLRGGCIHHDHGVLGAAAYPAAELRKISRLKEAGFNALRIAHNPPSLALLEVCDRIGMIVMDEAFDQWNHQKNANDYHLWFADWYARDIASMVQRDRSHPCVICYSIGNEIPETAGYSDMGKWSERLAAEIRKHDDSRFTTVANWEIPMNPEFTDPEDYKADFNKKYNQSADNSVSWADRTEALYAPHSIAGYNYMYGHYVKDHERFPNRVIWGSETHVIHFYHSWHAVLDNPHVIGDFTWTAYDNLGEAGTGRAAWARDGHISGISMAEYPWRSCYQGDLDLCGYRRPQSYFRESVWFGGTEPKIFTTHPEHYGEDFSGTGWHWYDVLDTWTFDDVYLGKPVKCEVYTDADEIEWTLNGKILGRTAPDKGIAVMDIPYEKGCVTASAYKNGACVGTSSLHTVGVPAAVKVEAECTDFAADNRDLCYFDLTVTDADGNRVPDACCALNCLVDGGTLLGIFSGDPKNEDQYTSAQCHAFEGRALAIVKADKPGCVTLTVGGAELASGRASAMAY